MIGLKSVLNNARFHVDAISVDFQTCRIADPHESAGREAALEVGLETCAASGQAVRSYSKL
jgi:hypothetical protein